MSLPLNHLSYLSHTFVQYKTLLEDWSNYIDNLYENDQDASFTPDMESNIFVDFTRLINVDMKSFIIAMAGNCHTRQRVSASYLTLFSYSHRSNFLHWFRLNMFYFIFRFMLSNICYHSKNQRSYSEVPNKRAE